jgi:predicted kinase
MEDPHEYRFNPAQLPEAHSACLRRFVALCETGTDVVVDNTNTTAVELAPYVALAGMYGYEVEIIRLHCDPFLAAKRNTHGVPEKAVLAMHARLMSDRLPPFWPQEQIIVVDRPIPALMAG